MRSIATPIRLGRQATSPVVAGQFKSDIDAGFMPGTSTIGDFVWDDDNGNGIQDAGEGRVGEVYVMLWTEEDECVGTTYSDADGYYSFENLGSGSYYVTFELPENYHFSPANQGADDALDSDADATGQTAVFTLGVGQTKNDVDAGLVLVGGSIGDWVWEDANHDGIQDGDEWGMPDVTVDLYTSGGTLVATTTTEADGTYRFHTIAPGDYYLRFQAPSGYAFTIQNAGADDEWDSDVNSSGQSPVFTISLGSNETSLDAGLRAVDISINDVSQNEGASGTTSFTFTVNLSVAALQTVSVTYATADGSATTADIDYGSNGGTVTFNAGETSKTVTVIVYGDTKYEPNETFFVNLSNPTNAFITDGQGVGTIVNDDAAPYIKSFTDGGDYEGNTGQKTFGFAVTLSNPSYQTITVWYYTSDGTATIADGDYVPTSAMITFNPGQTVAAAAVLVNGDTKLEPHETFLIFLTNSVNAPILDNQAVGTIVNDDVKPTISINDVGNYEGNSGNTALTFTVWLSNASYQAVGVHYETKDNTAKVADNDYAAKSANLTFQPGQTTKTITVLVKGDRKFELNENFLVKLSNASNAYIGDAWGVGGIVNDDAYPALVINDVARFEGNSGYKDFVFTVSLLNPSFQQVKVKYVTGNGTATAPSDYAARGGTLTFSPGQTRKRGRDL